MKYLIYSFLVFNLLILSTADAHPSKDPVKVQIITPDKDCVLYEEDNLIKPYKFNVGSRVNDPKRTKNDSGLKMGMIFTNSGAMTVNPLLCPAGVYNPAFGDVRYIRIINSTNNTKVMPDIGLDFTNW